MAKKEKPLTGHCEDCGMMMKMKTTTVRRDSMVCKSCNGVGMLASKFGDKKDDPFPCSDCLENGTCPKCDKEMILTEKTQSYHCPHCGWDEEGF